jgi:hypothetical protein
MKPDVRIIQDQSVETKTLDPTSSEAAALLAKYGYSTSHIPHHQIVETPGETFEEMVARQQRESNPKPRINTPNSITFDSRNIGHASEEYRELDSGFGMKVTIVSDMKF